MNAASTTELHRLRFNFADTALALELVIVASVLIWLDDVVLDFQHAMKHLRLKLLIDGHNDILASESTKDNENTTATFVGSVVNILAVNIGPVFVEFHRARVKHGFIVILLMIA